MTDNITIPRATVQQALEALQNCANGEDDVLLTRDALATLRTALEQQAEPVAWMTHSHDLLPLFHRTERAALVWGAEPTPLYTTPPQRKPLTDEEIDQLLPEIVSGGSFTVVTYGRAVARAIEAKLKGKNA